VRCSLASKSEIAAAGRARNVARMPRRVPELQPRLRFPDAGPDAFGPGKAELLHHIAATGSIRTAATEMGLSYDRAWKLVRGMNSLFRTPLVAVARGGGTGGGASLTPLGEEVLVRYARMEAACRAATRDDWNALLRQLR
jgi:molybdate transport system regulatory protein